MDVPIFKGYSQGTIATPIYLSQLMAYMGFITARKRSCGKVMFLQVSVILFTGGCACSRGVLGGAWGACSGGVPGGDPPRLLLRAVCILLECILVTVNTHIDILHKTFVAIKKSQSQSYNVDNPLISTYWIFRSASNSLLKRFDPTPVTATLTFSLGSEGRMTSHFLLIISVTGLQPDSRGIWNRYTLAKPSLTA